MSERYALSETVRVALSVAWTVDEINVMVQYPLVVKVDNKQSKTFQEGTCIKSRPRGAVDLPTCEYNEYQPTLIRRTC